MPQVLGVELYEFDIKTAVGDIVSDISLQGTRENRLISATGVHGLVTAQQNPEFKNILSKFYYNLPDGMPGVWVGKLKGAKKMLRCPGPHFFEAMMKVPDDKKVTHFFCGGKEGVADELKAAVEKKFGNHSVVGTYCPPFREMSDEELKELGDQINATRPNVIWIGLSSPKQEKFAYRLRAFTDANYLVTVGAAFDFHTDKLKTAPVWMQESGFEWLFRLMMEPKRLYKRYFSIIPLFLYYNVREAITSIKHKN